MTSEQSSGARGRTYILGADGATWSVIERLLDAGDLPNFRRAMDAGAFGPLESVENMRSASAWTSMFTGCNPGKHGIYEFYEFLPESYSLKFINGSYKQVPGFWTYLDRDGQSVGLINVPMTYPAEPVAQGYSIAGLDGPGKSSPRFGYPDDFIETLESKMGRDYVVEPGLTSAIARGNPQEAVDLLMDELESKTRALEVMLNDMPVDCLEFVYRSLDAAQHGFWKWMDPTHPKHDPNATAENAKYGRVIDDVYRHIDGALGMILDHMGPDDSLLVLSDHGFGPKCPVSSQLNRWLEAHGYLVYEKGGDQPGLVSKLLKVVASKTSRKTKERLARLLPWLRDWAQSKALFSGVDWSKTRVYSDAQFPRLRLNIKGREGQGIVDPADAPALMKELRAKLSEMRDSKTGEPIVRDIFFKEEIYKGAHTGPAEDILVRWREDIIIHGVEMPPGFEQPEDELSVMPGEDPKVISGDHQIHGVFLGVGPAFRPGAQVEGLRLLDMTPTILHLRGLPIPSNMDGRVMTAAMTDDWLTAHPVRTTDTTLESPSTTPTDRNGGNSSTDSSAAAYSEEEEKVLEERLRSLGYIE
ncbi:MAG: alkaline phosphatase family protein [Phycisphaerales bacterium]